MEGILFGLSRLRGGGVDAAFLLQFTERRSRDVHQHQNRVRLLRRGARVRILAVVSYFPLPQDHGDALRCLMMLQALDRVGSLTIAAAHRVATTEADVQALRSMFPDSRVLVEALAPYSGPSKAAKISRTLIGVTRGLPPWVYRQWSPSLARAVNALDPTDFDFVVLIGESSGLYARSIRGPRVVWDKSNVLLATDLHTIRVAGSAGARLRSLITLPFTWSFEKRILRRSDDVWVTTVEEGQRLERFYGRNAAAVIPSCVTISSDPVEIDTSSKTIVWMSTLSYRPNWDGLRSFLTANAEALHETGWTVRVVGAGGSPTHARHLSEYPCVEYLGFVPELTDAFVGVAFAIVPLWSGAGVKLKTLTFLGYGVPVVSTAIGMEGIPLDAATALFDTPEDFSSIAPTLTPEVLRAGALRGRLRVVEQFSPESFLTYAHSAVSAEHHNQPDTRL